MAKNKKGLGMGLDALLKMNVRDEGKKNNAQSDDEKVLAGFVEMQIQKIVPNQDQPRKRFDEQQLDDLAQSIKNFGIIQPITVIRKNDHYEIVAGERRYRAAKQIGLDKIPVIIKDISQKEKLEISLVENIQRENLNPIEEALAYSSLIETYNITQEKLAQTLGKSRTSITNSIRLLNLDIQVRSWIMEGKLTPGHARAILSITDDKQHILFANYAMQNNLSVRDAEVLARKWPFKKQKKNDYVNLTGKEVEITQAEKKLQQRLQTKVLIIGDSKKGKIQIDYFTQDELERIIDLIGAEL